VLRALEKQGVPRDEIKQALEDGRVFCRGQRIADISVMVEGEVTIASPRDHGPAWEPEIVLQTEDFVVVNKPAGMSTIGDLSGQAGTLRSWVQERIGVDAHPTSRLDRPVSGLVTFALTPWARDHADLAREQHRYSRDYLAIVVGRIEAATEWAFPIAKHPQKPMLRAVHAKGDPAQTKVLPIAWTDKASVLRLQPITGRTHQLRVHCAHAGHAIVGDADYGGVARWVLPTGSIIAIVRVMLHCARVEIALPKRVLQASAPVPDDFAAVAKSLGFESITLPET
jgi:RluA family pseudouridine synthase